MADDFSSGDADWSGGLVSGVASLGAAGLGYAGQMQTNAMNQQEFQQQLQFNANAQTNAQDFSAQQAQNQMNFQERMSDTAYQRQTADMVAAGINPILAAVKGGGASSPSGASGSGSPVSAGSAPKMESPIGGGLASGLDVLKASQAQRSTDSQLSLNKALQDTARADAVLKSNNGRTAAANAEMAESQIRATKAEADLREKKAGIDNKYLQWDSIGDRLRRDSGTVSNALGAFGKGWSLFGGSGDVTPKSPRGWNSGVFGPYDAGQ